MVKKTAFLIFSMLACTNLHAGQSGLFFSSEIGLSQSDGKATIEGTTPSNTVEEEPGAEFESDISYGFSLGYEFKGGLGVELAYTFTRYAPENSAQVIPARSNFISFLEGETEESFFYGGEAETNNYSINLSYRFDNRTSFTPYIMAGMGYAEVEVNASLNVEPTFEVFGEPLQTFESHTDSVKTWTAGAGLSWELNEALTIDTEISLTDFDSGISTLSDIDGNSVFFNDLNTTKVSVSLTYFF